RPAEGGGEVDAPARVGVDPGDARPDDVLDARQQLIPAEPVGSPCVASLRTQLVAMQHKGIGPVALDLLSQIEKRGGKLAQDVEVERAGRNDLDTDVVGARVEMLLDAGANGVDVAPGHDLLEEPIAAAVREIVIREAEPEQMVAIVLDRQVE